MRYPPRIVSLLRCAARSYFRKIGRSGGCDKLA
jgi:hypothetical protein